jgi:Predicted metal-dependent hydrolase with the TIM-barrel fold
MTTERPADLVLTGGRIATVDAVRSWASALAVRDGRIVAVGPDSAVTAHIGPATRVVALRGRTVTPGFGDSHVHPLHGGLARLRCELHDAHGLDSYLEIVATYARTNPDVPWIRGGGWSMDDFPGGVPSRADLDRVAPDRPVFLSSRDGHSAWVNTKALELAGITARTVDPADGRIEREPDGTPGGGLQEGAQALVDQFLPDTTNEELEAALALAQAYLHSLGITTWQDAIITPGTEERAYVALAGRGELTAKVVGALWWERGRGVEQIDEFVDRRAATAIGRYQPTSVKLMMDGVLENFTGTMLESYLDGSGKPTGNRGISMIDPAVLDVAVPRLDALGFQAHFHAIGDRAVREALDAVAAMRRANGPSDTRPHIAHIQVIHPDDVGRFRELGVVANAQPYWAVFEDQMDDLTIPFLGPERADWQYPFRSLLDAGAMLAMGSDWSVSTPDPMAEMEVAVNRVADYNRDGRAAFLPGQRIGLMDALAAFTIGSAYVNHQDRDTGSIEVGKAADLAVLDRDLFDRAAGPVGETRCIATFVDGVAVYEDPALDG